MFELCTTALKLGVLATLADATEGLFYATLEVLFTASRAGDEWILLNIATQLFLWSVTAN